MRNVTQAENVQQVNEYVNVSLPNCRLLLAIGNVFVREATPEDYAFVEEVTRAMRVPANDSVTMKKRGALPDTVTSKNIEAMLALGNAKLLIAERLGKNDQLEPVGFQVSIWGDFLVPVNSEEWKGWVDPSKTNPDFPGYGTVTRELLEIDEGDRCHDMLLAKYQGEGIGTALSLAALLDAKAAGCEYYYAEIDERNRPSRKFHKSLGMKKEKTDPENVSVFKVDGGEEVPVQWLSYKINPQKLSDEDIENIKAKAIQRMQRER